MLWPDSRPPSTPRSYLWARGWLRASDARHASIRCIRTTLDIDPIILEELRRRRAEEGRSLGDLVSELLSQALTADRERRSGEPLDWRTSSMNARMDLEDDEAVRNALERQ